MAKARAGVGKPGLLTADGDGPGSSEDVKKMIKGA